MGIHQLIEATNSSTDFLLLQHQPLGLTNTWANDPNPVVSPFFANTKKASKCISNNKPFFNDLYRLSKRCVCYGNDKSEPLFKEGRVVNTANKATKRLNVKRKSQCQGFETLGNQNDGYCYQSQNIEQRLHDKSLPRLVSFDLQQIADTPYWLQKKLSYFGNVKADPKEENNKRNWMEKIQNERLALALDVTSPKAISPYFLKKEAHVCENSIIECLKQTKNKLRKQRTIKQTQVIKKRPRKTKKKNKLIHQFSMQQHDKNDTLAWDWDSQFVASDGLRITVENDSPHQTVCQKYWINPGHNKHDEDMGNETGDVESKKDCATYRKGCITNAKRKQVKSLQTLKISKNEDDQITHGGLGACDLMITTINRKVEKKMKQKTASPKCATSADKEADLVSLSIASQKELIHYNLDGPKTLAAKVVSPYFQKLSENFECDVERDESKCKGKKRGRLNRTANIEFEDIISKYAYKGGSHINREVDIGGREEKEEDGSAEKSKRKGKKKRDRSRSLSAAEKRAEAYQRKEPDCTWRPPRSPYNLLQEDHSYDPWRVLVICILLNITTGPQVKRVLSLFFDVCPNAEAAVDADELRIASLIQSLGLHRKRAAMIQRFSREYLSDNWTHVTQLHGIGKYAADAYAMFCNGKWHQVTPNDHMLNYYWKFLQNRGLDFKDVAL